jgi:hypothetical protein
MLQKSFRLASPFFGSLLLYPRTRLAAGVDYITALLLDQGHARSILPLVFGFFDDGSFDKLFRWVKVDGSFISAPLPAGGKRGVPNRRIGP